MTTISRAAFNTLLPPGSLWVLEDEEGFDLLLEGIADNFEVVKAELDKLALIRTPLLTDLLDDLEKEYGLSKNNALTELERRNALLAAKTARKSTGTEDFLEDALQLAGFDVQVHVNNPPVDPALFVAEEMFLYVCGGVDVVCGRVESPGPPNPLDIVAGAGLGELLVNGDAIIRLDIFTIVSGSPVASCGNANNVCGATSGSNTFELTYPLPTDPGYWGLVFFVGGDATRDAITGELQTIDFVEIPLERRSEFKRLILKYKPIHSWAGLMVRFT